MRTEVLEYILCVAELGSISKAAEEKHINQTTLSAAIKSVEEELGIELFLRQYNGIQLTEQGEQFIPIAKSILNEYQQMLCIGKQDNQSLSIYVNKSVYDVFVQDLYPQIVKAISDLSIKIYRIDPMTYQEICNKNAERSIGIDYVPTNQIDEYVRNNKRKQLVYTPLMTTELMAYVGRNNRLAKKKTVTLEGLKDERVIFGKHSKEQLLLIDDYLRNYSVVEGPGITQMLDMAVETESVAVIPDIKTMPKKDISALYTKVIPLQLQTDNNLKHTQCLIYRKNMILSAKERKIISMIKERFHD